MSCSGFPQPSKTRGDWGCGLWCCCYKYSLKIKNLHSNSLNPLNSWSYNVKKLCFYHPVYTHGFNSEHFEGVSKIQTVNSHSEYLLFRSMLSFSSYPSGLLWSHKSPCFCCRAAALWRKGRRIPSFFCLGLPHRFNMVGEFDAQCSHCPVLETAVECTCSAAAAEEKCACLPATLTTACFLFLPNLELPIHALV